MLCNNLCGRTLVYSCWLYHLLTLKGHVWCGVLLHPTAVDGNTFINNTVDDNNIFFSPKYYKEETIHVSYKSELLCFNLSLIIKKKAKAFYKYTNPCTLWNKVWKTGSYRQGCFIASKHIPEIRQLICNVLYSRIL